MRQHCYKHNTPMYEEGPYGAKCPDCERERTDLDMLARADEQAMLLAEQVEIEKRKLALSEKRRSEEGDCGRCGQRFQDATRRFPEAGSTWTGTLCEFATTGVCPKCFYSLKNAEVKAWSQEEWYRHFEAKLDSLASVREAEALSAELRTTKWADLYARAQAAYASFVSRERASRTEQLGAVKTSTEAAALARELRAVGFSDLASQADVIEKRLCEQERTVAAENAERELRLKAEAHARERDARMLQERKNAWRHAFRPVANAIDALVLQLRNSKMDALAATSAVGTLATALHALVLVPDNVREVADIDLSVIPALLVNCDVAKKRLVDISSEQAELKSFRDRIDRGDANSCKGGGGIEGRIPLLREALFAKQVNARRGILRRVFNPKSQELWEIEGRVRSTYGYTADDIEARLAEFTRHIEAEQRTAREVRTSVQELLDGLAQAGAFKPDESASS